MITSRALLRVVATSIAVLALSVAAVGWIVVDGLDAVGSSTTGADRVFVTLRKTIDVTSETTATVRDALSDVDRLAGLVGTSSETTASLVDGVAELTATRIPASLRAVEDSMPALIEAGSVIDSTLHTLSLFGVAYNPATSFDEALRDVQSSLKGLPDDIAAQGEQLRTLAPAIRDVGATATGLAGRVEDTRARLAEAEALLAEYRTVLSDAETAVGQVSGPIRYIAVGRVLLVLVAASGIVLALGVWRFGDLVVLREVST